MGTYHHVEPWFTTGLIKHFKEGSEQVENDPRDENTKLVPNLIEEDCGITTDEAANHVVISPGSASVILNENLGLSKLSARCSQKHFTKTNKLKGLTFM